MQRLLLSLTLLLSTCCHLLALDTVEECFDVWYRNRLTYRAYQDSIFQPTDRDAWVQLCIRRAACYRKMYAENQQAIDFINRHFNDASHPASTAEYDSLFWLCENRGKGVDVFMAEDLMKLALSFHQQHHETPQQQLMLVTELYYLASFNYQYASIGDPEGLRRSYAYICQLFDFFKNGCTVRDVYDLQVRTLLAYGLYARMAEDYLKAGIVTKNQADSLIYAARQDLRSPAWNQTYDFIYGRVDSVETLLEGTMSSDVVRRMLKRYLSFIDKYEQNTWINGLYLHWVNHPTEDNRRELATAAQDFALDSVYAHDKVLLTRAHWALGDINADTTFARIEMHMPDTLPSATDVIEGGLGEALSHIPLLLPILSHTSLSDEERRAYVCDWTRYFLLLLDYCKGQNDIRNTVYIEDFVTNPTLNRYLSSEQRIEMLNRVMMSAQITTYAHSTHLAELAQTLLDAIIRLRPELLTSLPEYATVADVIAGRQSLQHFIWQAAMYHDIGKNSMAPLITNDFRRLYDHEFQIIKTHPTKGLLFLDLDPALQRFRDTTLGHHRWYNGQGGYPASFDNTQSPQRILIDIITLCDCLEAATDAVGRNYNQNKTYETVLREFESQAGTRYNPEIIRLMREDPDLYRQLDYLVSPEGCYANYYDVYKVFFKMEQ